jgi:hypothetical protein
MPSHWAGLLDFAANPPGSPALVILSNIISPAAYQPTAEQMRYVIFPFSMALIFQMQRIHFTALHTPCSIQMLWRV